MRFFNQTEDVLDIQLTSLGKKQYSEGKFRPKYYSFSDEGVLYNLQNVGLLEEQNDTNARIVDETPYPKVQSYFAQTNPGDVSERQLNALSEFYSNIQLNSNFAQHVQYVNTKTKINSLGTIDNQNKQQSPRFKIYFIDSDVENISGEYDSLGITAQDVSGSSQRIQAIVSDKSYSHDPLKIPQINVELMHKTMVTDAADPESFGGNILFKTNSQVEGDGLYTGEFTTSDGGMVQAYIPDLLLLVEEENCDNNYENFDIEVYEIMEEISELTGNKKLRKLIFPLVKEDILYKDGLLLDQKKVDEFIGVRNSISSGIERNFSKNNVDYYLNLLTDTYSEIDESRICASISEIKSKGFQLDIPYTCPDNNLVDDRPYDIYDRVLNDQEKC